MSDYKQVYKNTGLTPRTFDQAYKTADYATALWRCETPNEKSIKLLFNLVMVGFMLGLITFSLYALMMFVS